MEMKSYPVTWLGSWGGGSVGSLRGCSPSPPTTAHRESRQVGLPWDTVFGDLGAPERPLGADHGAEAGGQEMAGRSFWAQPVFGNVIPGLPGSRLL